jgi:protein SCO1/2
MVRGGNGKDMAARISRRRAAAVALLAACAGIGAWVWQANAPATSGGPFTLVDGSGATVRDRDFRGRYLIVFFGYSYCPDVCPTALGKLATVLDRLSEKQGGQVAVLFISVDPQRDHGARLTEYAHAFHPRITGLTGTREQIDAVVKAYGARYQFAGDTSRDDYGIDHTTSIYLMDPQGHYVTRFSYNASPESMLAKLQSVLK